MDIIKDVTPQKLCCRFEAHKDAIPKVLSAMIQWGQEHNIPFTTVCAVNLILDEMISNIIKHGRQANRDDIALNIYRQKNQVEVVLSDAALPFDPLSASLPDITQDVEHRPIGGLGIHFLRSMASSVGYCFDGQRNQLIFTRRYGKEKSLEKKKGNSN